jgi:hypothetical protein
MMACFSVGDVLLAPSRRIFPSPQIELYTEESTVLGIIKPSDVQIVTIGPVDVTEVVDAAEERFRKSLSRLPDFTEDYQENPSKHRTHEIHKIEIHVLSSNTKLFHGVDES